MPSLNFGNITSLSFIFCEIAKLCLLCFLDLYLGYLALLEKKLSKAVTKSHL